MHCRSAQSERVGTLRPQRLTIRRSPMLKRDFARLPARPAVAFLELLESDVVTLWRPVGPRELELIAASGMREFPPRLPEQPIFYPVLTEAYATKIARDWNAPRGGGFVTRFQVRRDFMWRYLVQDAGGRAHLEYWIPAEDLPAFNNAIVGQIEVVAEFAATNPPSGA
jgi:hypothetical protein